MAATSARLIAMIHQRQDQQQQYSAPLCKVVDSLLPFVFARQHSHTIKKNNNKKIPTRAQWQQ